jgi:hypothetical protein
LEWKKLFFGHTMALELSKQAYALCREQDASGLRAFLEAHSADIDEQESPESPECLQVLLETSGQM